MSTFHLNYGKQENYRTVPEGESSNDFHNESQAVVPIGTKLSTTGKANIENPDLLLKSILRENDFKGFELLHRRYYTMLCHYVFRFVKCKEISKDLVADVFFTMWKNRNNLEIKSSCRAYLFTAVKNRAYNYLQREAKECVEVDTRSHEKAIEYHNPERILLYGELSKKIEASIDRLSPRCKKVFKLSRQEGLKYSEIAERLNISTKAVEANITRGLKSLRQAIDLP